MWIKLDFHSGQPVYRQIVEALKNEVIRGRVNPEIPLPSIRELAISLKVNPNTVARAYQELEHEGIIYSRPGIGTFIKLTDKQLIKQRALEIIKIDMTKIISKAKKYEISQTDLSKLIDQVTTKVYGGE